MLSKNSSKITTIITSNVSSIASKTGWGCNFFLIVLYLCNTKQQKEITDDLLRVKMNIIYKYYKQWMNFYGLHLTQFLSVNTKHLLKMLNSFQN